MNTEVVNAIFYHMWAEYRNSLWGFIVFFYTLFFLASAIFMMVLMEGNRENLQAKSTKEYFPFFFETVEIVYLVSLLFHVFIEVFQLAKEGRKYWRITMNVFDFFILFLHIGMYAMRSWLLHMTMNEEIYLFEKGYIYTINFKFLRQIGGFVLLMMAFKFSQVLSVSGAIAFYNALIMQTLAEMRSFLVIIGISIFSISAFSFMLSKNRRLYHDPDLYEFAESIDNP